MFTTSTPPIAPADLSAGSFDNVGLEGSELELFMDGVEKAKAMLVGRSGLVAVTIRHAGDERGEVFSVSMVPTAAPVPVELHEGGGSEEVVQ